MIRVARLLIPAVLMLLAPLARTATAEGPPVRVTWEHATTLYEPPGPCYARVVVPPVHLHPSVDGRPFQLVTGTLIEHRAGRPWPVRRLHWIAPDAVIEFQASTVDGHHFTRRCAGSISPMPGETWAYRAGAASGLPPGADIGCFRGVGDNSRVFPADPLELAVAAFEYPCIDGGHPNAIVQFDMGRLTGTNYSNDFSRRREIGVCDTGQFFGAVGAEYIRIVLYSGDWTEGELSTEDEEEPPMADFNGSGAVSVQDIFDFLGAWASGAPRADVDHSRAVDAGDLLAFLTEWFAH